LADKDAAEVLNKWIDGDTDLIGTLDLFTYAETRALLDNLQGSAATQIAGLSAIDKATFVKTVREWGKEYITLWKKDGAQNLAREDYELDSVLSKRY
jgi:hypothetical protein